MREVGVVGVGLTRFTRHPGELKPLVESAVLESLRDAGLDLSDVQAIFSGSVYTPVNGNAQTNLRDLPTRGVPIVNVENACASGSSAVQMACAWLQAGICDVALAIGMDKTSWIDGPLPMPSGRWYFDLGLMTPNWYGLQASAYMARHGATPEDMGRVAVKSRSLAVHNPRAHFSAAVTLEEVMASRPIATPFTLHQCCPKTDGAGALLLASRRYIEQHGLRATWVRSSRLMSGKPAFSNDAGVPDTAARLAQETLRAAQIGPRDLQLIEVHDAFTIGEFIYSEAIGICEPGGYAAYLKQGRAVPGGNGVAVNPSGGLLSRGHPMGATGIAQIAEIVWQLRGQAGARQVEGARFGMTLTMGAFEWERDVNVAAGFVLEAG
jgi:acetyl-CoA acetyltransferase